uniref:Uncharacterized protein n=1 Tax=Terrapene triunguis TaxID=2587831 RepID=A0A674JDN3_9SAUR
MGNTTSCCISPSHKLGRNAHSQLESYCPEPELSREDMGCNLQHISDRENIDGKRIILLRSLCVFPLLIQHGLMWHCLHWARPHSLNYEFHK